MNETISLHSIQNRKECTMKRTNSISIIGAALVMLVGLTVWAASTPDSETNVASRAYLHSYNNHRQSAIENRLSV